MFLMKLIIIEIQVKLCQRKKDFFEFLYVLLLLFFYNKIRKKNISILNNIILSYILIFISIFTQFYITFYITYKFN